MVNAIQRHATVIVHKSLAEGFGLTVAEGMWRGRPVVGSAVGGILDQIAGGTGVLLPDPADLATFGSQVRRLLDSPDDARLMGAAGSSPTSRRAARDKRRFSVSPFTSSSACSVVACVGRCEVT